MKADFSLTVIRWIRCGGLSDRCVPGSSLERKDKAHLLESHPLQSLSALLSKNIQDFTTSNKCPAIDVRSKTVDGNNTYGINFRFSFFRFFFFFLNHILVDKIFIFRFKTINYINERLN